MSEANERARARAEAPAHACWRNEMSREREMTARLPVPVPRGQFIGRPQTFVELKLRFKVQFPSVIMQFVT